MAFNYNLLYHNISPFCEPLSFDLPQEFYAVFLTNFLLYLYKLSPLFCHNRLPYILHYFLFVYEFFLCVSIQIFSPLCSKWIPMYFTNFTLLFCTNFLCLFHTNFFSLFATNKIGQTILLI